MRFNAQSRRQEYPEAPLQRQKLVNLMHNDDWNIGLRLCPEEMSCEEDQQQQKFTLC